MSQSYDALLFVSFGGPEGPDEVLPFLENVLRGRNVPRARMLEVAEHYQEFGGVSPINGQNRALIAALRRDFEEQGLDLPIYWGNRNWHPLLEDTVQQLQKDGVRHAVAFVTSAFSSYSGCRQYREDIAQACAAVGEGSPQIDKLRVYFNHPGFIEAQADRVQTAWAQLEPAGQKRAKLVFTAHSIPQAMAKNCAYTDQLAQSCRLVAEKVGVTDWTLVYQSRSGPPQQPWLEPDICDYLKQLPQTEDISNVVIVPIGFVSDHMEVLFDLDTEAQQVCNELGLNLVRAGTVGTHPRFVAMVRELILERMGKAPREALGELGPCPDVCPEDCCLPR